MSNKPKYKAIKILSDEEIRELTEYTMIGEGGEGADLAGFEEAAEIIGKAMEPYKKHFCDPVKALIFSIRTAYLLGVQHGAEEYRIASSDWLKYDDCEPFPSMKFELLQSAAEDFWEQMEYEVPAEYLRDVCTKIGFIFMEDNGGKRKRQRKPPSTWRNC